ncbi:Similar to 85 kDa calcium-independent phospholipase A2; acc. no. P97570 [Pyronema omphalodes CBS 100304]|uniref:Similar to 85 kDa calcium-independent phospholipase A2 acc. no. P97570 n=1 Tax=Pyronema omphalodes (strain CBS 100304) TaxID=1076935 RepID=U4KUK1_PYROM|nr:Similar to 85 kDa calcium-independent phospholipase A2; acc. no. P97570 [Pyronema omphalodes CBS 100304]
MKYLSRYELDVLEFNTTVKGMIPLYCAVEWRNKEVIEVLLEFGAEIDAADEHGKSPLAYACVRKDQEEIIGVLLEYGADAEMPDDYAERPLDCAKRMKNEVVIKAGADDSEAEEDEEDDEYGGCEEDEGDEQNVFASNEDYEKYD